MLPDVASVFLLNAGVTSGEAMLKRVACSNLRYATMNNLDSTREVLGLLYPLLQIVAPQYAAAALHSEIDIRSSVKPLANCAHAIV